MNKIKMEEKKFFHAYQTIKFQEDSSDCFSVAATRRKLLALNFYGSVHLKRSGEVTEFLVNEELREYGKVVDDRNPGKVNNYADAVLSLLSNYKNDDMKNWKSHLNEINVKEFLKPFPCSNDIKCKNSQLISDALKEVKFAFEKYEETDEINEAEKCREPVKSLVPEKSTALGKRPIKPTELENSKAFANFVEPKTSKIKNISDEKEKESTPKDTLVFRTAWDELQIQNAKKFGKNSNTNENFSYGSGKKSLGTRKGVYAKFQPPIRSKENKEEERQSKMDVDETVDERLKNIDPAMIELIKNEIMDCGSKITWDDIAGLHLAKATIQEIVVWPMLRPDIFTGLRRPPKGILLFGPPGTGKTLIGKCIASQSNSTFFSISASSLTSKWVGDGEKMVRTLFAVAKVQQPSVVFIDEIDSLLSQRSDSEHECSRRIKTEFLVQLDGAGTGDEDRILIIGATNRPQELDEAARRRLVKRLYIPLPDEEARKQIIENLISTERHCLEKHEVEKIARLTKGYSGADVKNLCQEASLGPIRSIPPSMIQSIDPEDVRPLNCKDFESALCRIKSSVSESDLDTYVAWDKQYGCGSDSHS